MCRVLVYLVAVCSVLATVEGCYTDFYYDHAIGMCRPCSGICSPGQVVAACNTHAECAAYIIAQQKTPKDGSSVSVQVEKIPPNRDNLQKNDLNSDTDSGSLPDPGSNTKKSEAVMTIPTWALVVVIALIIAILVTVLSVIVFFYVKERRNSNNNTQNQNNDEPLHVSIEETGQQWTERQHIPSGSVDVNDIFGGRGPSNIHPANEMLLFHSVV